MSHRYLVLGLLAERPMSGYDIKKQVQTTLGSVTNASYGTLYPTLHKLLAEGAVEMREIPQQGRPAKKVYSITAEGQRELTDWLTLPAAGDQVRREFLLKLYLARDLSEKNLQTLLTNRRHEAEARLRVLEDQMQDADDPYHVWVIEYALAQYRAEIRWLDRLDKQMGNTC